MSEVAEVAGNVAADIVEESVDGVVEVLEVVRNNPVSLALVGAAGVLVGGVAAYFFTKKKLTDFYEEQIQIEIKAAKEFYAGVYKTDEAGKPLSPGEVLAQRHAEEALLEYRGAIDVGDVSDEVFAEPRDDVVDEAQIRKIEARVKHVSVDKKVETVEEVDGTIRTTEVQESRNVFVDPNFDLEEEIRLRTKTAPYVISHDEFFEAEKDYENVTLTYYEGDDVLANDSDEPQNDVDKLIGDEQLIRFGHGSKDPSIVYVRNDRLELDFEVVKSEGSYVEEVLGITPDEGGTLRHSNDRYRRRAFRHGED